MFMFMEMPWGCARGVCAVGRPQVCWVGVLPRRGSVGDVGVWCEIVCYNTARRRVGKGSPRLLWRLRNRYESV